MNDETKILNELGCKVIQVVDGTDNPPGSYYHFNDKLETYYTLKTHEIHHRIVAGYDSTYVVLFSEHDIRRLGQKLHDYNYMSTLFSESQKVLQEDAKERKIRNSNKGVAEAYEHYKFMLNLAK